MKNIFKFFLMLPLALSLVSCGEPSEEDQRIANDVSQCAAIAQLMRGRDGVQVMFTSDQSVNDIYKPYYPPHESHEKPIYTSSLLLSVWFELEEDSNKKATLEWTFDKPEYVKVTPPASNKLPHETVSFTKYPSYGEEIIVKMQGKINYNGAIAYANYDLRLLNTVK